MFDPASDWSPRDIGLRAELHDKGTLGRQWRGGLQFAVGFCWWLWYVPTHGEDTSKVRNAKSRGSYEICTRKLRDDSRLLAEAIMEADRQLTYDRARRDLPNSQLRLGKRTLA